MWYLLYEMQSQGRCQKVWKKFHDKYSCFDFISEMGTDISVETVFYQQG